MTRILSKLLGDKNNYDLTKRRKAQLGFELLEDRLVQSTFSYMSLIESPSLSTVTASEATYNPSITAVDISANELSPIQVVQPMEVDANTIAPIEGFQPLIDVADPRAEFTPATGGSIQIQTFNKADRLANGRAAIEARLGETKADLVFGPAVSDAYSIDNGYGVRRDFSKGSMFWSPETGAHFVSTDIMWKFGRINRFGMYPENDTRQLKDWQPGSTRGAAPAMFNDFYNVHLKQMATIVSSPGNISVIQGMIRTKWLELGSGRFGVPLNDGFDGYGGKIQTFWFRGFTRGQIPVKHALHGGDGELMAEITHHPKTGTHVILNDGIYGSRLGWINSGRASQYGGWGFPTSDEFEITSHGYPVFNRVVHFMNPNTGGARMAHVSMELPNLQALQAPVIGAFYQEWMRRGGLHSFGTPLSAEQDKGDHFVQLFAPMKDGAPNHDRHMQMVLVKSTNELVISYWVRTVEGNYVREGYSKVSSGMTVEEEVLSDDPSIVESLISYHQPVMTDASLAGTSASMMDTWNERLAAAVELDFGLFTEPWDGATVSASEALDYGSWFTPLPTADDFAEASSESAEENVAEELATETPAEEEYAAEDEMFEEPVSEVAIDEVFAEEFLASEEGPELDPTLTEEAA